MLPQIAARSTQNLIIKAYPTKTYKLSRERTINNVDNIPAIKQVIFHILNTERYAYPIYDDNYGIGLQKYIGKNFAYVKANIGREIRESLLYDDRIEEVTINSITQTGLNKMQIEITVVSSEGTFSAIGTASEGEWQFDDI